MPSELRSAVNRRAHELARIEVATIRDELQAFVDDALKRGMTRHQAIGELAFFVRSRTTRGTHE